MIQLAESAPPKWPPVSVRLACVIMAGLALFDVSLAVFVAMRLSGDGGFLNNAIAQFAAGVLGVKALVSGGFAVFIWRGQGWSRIVYAVLVGLSLAMSWYEIIHLELVMPILEAGSVILLFLPASEHWFARTAMVPAAAAEGPGMVPRPAGPAPSPGTIYAGVSAMFVVLAVGLGCGWAQFSAWMNTWPQDDTGIVYFLIFMVLFGALVVGDILLTAVLAILILKGSGAARFVYGCTTALGLRLLLAIPGKVSVWEPVLYACCLACFILLFIPPSHRWLRARRA